MRSFFQRHHRLLFYISWIILGIIQSRSTELLDDEAYYWVYSKFLDWGYFDHPPLVALLIKMGYSVFQNELEELRAKLPVHLQNDSTYLH